MSTHLVTMSHKLQSFLRGHHHPILLDWLDLRMHSGLDEAAADGEVKVNRDAFRAGGGSNGEVKVNRDAFRAGGGSNGEVKVNRDAFRAGGGSNVDFDRYDLNQASGHG
jgi:hypothetical protein